MSEELSFETADGKTISGRFEVSHGTVTVTASDGRSTTAEIQNSMLSAEILARTLLFQLHRPKRTSSLHEDMDPTVKPINLLKVPKHAEKRPQKQKPPKKKSRAKAK
jgi:hypothetical protein